jgi:hypothetical protein
VASWADHKDEHDQQRQPAVCLACGTPLNMPFTHLGSLRCVECRSSDERLDPEIVSEWQANGGPLH